MINKSSNEPKIRKSGSQDVDRIMEIIAMAVEYMHSHGIAQWCDGYPQREQFLQTLPAVKATSVFWTGKLPVLRHCLLGKNRII